MNAERATGVILRTRPLTDTSLIIHWFTPDLGRLATVAKGARRAKSPFRGQLDLFYLAEFSFARSRRSDLHTLREVRVRETHPSLRQDLGFLQQASYCAALVEQATETETPLPDLFAQFAGLLEQLPRHPPVAQTVFAFELKLLHDLGLQPDPAETRLTPGARQMLDRLAHDDWESVYRLRPSPSQAQEIYQFLHGYLIYHLGKFPRGRNSAAGMH